MSEPGKKQFSYVPREKTVWEWSVERQTRARRRDDIDTRAELDSALRLIETMRRDAELASVADTVQLIEREHKASNEADSMRMAIMDFADRMKQRDEDVPEWIWDALEDVLICADIRYNGKHYE